MCFRLGSAPGLVVSACVYVSQDEVFRKSAEGLCTHMVKLFSSLTAVCPIAVKSHSSFQPSRSRMKREGGVVELYCS